MNDFATKLRQAKEAAKIAGTFAQFETMTIGQFLAVSSDPVDRMDSQFMLDLERRKEKEHRIVEITPADVLPLDKEGLPIDPDRVKFEAWLNPGNHPGNVSQFVSPGRYEDPRHGLAWRAWQAATRLAYEECSERLKKFNQENWPL